MVDAAGVPPIIRLIASPAGALFVRLTGNRAATRAMLRGNGHRPSLDNGRIPRAWIDWRTCHFTKRTQIANTQAIASSKLL
jgi:hypothetical protein